MTEERVLPVVSAVGLTKTFRDFWNRPKAAAVNDIDFEVRPGEVFGLLGPNGSGKSTTVKMLLGLLYPTAGRLTVFGESPKAVNVKSRIGYLPEETYLYKYLTAFETLDFFGSLFGLSAAERKSRVDQLLDMVGLAHARNRRVGEFSKGMARRIGLAQAMINDPEFLILDEPTSGLDPIGCREVKDLILALKKRGKTVLITSHLLGDVEDVCDRVVILYGGKIRAEGALSDLLKISGRDTITMDHLAEQDMEKILAECKKYTASPEVEHPHMSLEEFFLDVVEKAKADSATAGAKTGGGVAEYLQAEPVSGTETLDVLLKTESETSAGEEQAETAETSAPVHEEKLTELQEPETAAEPEFEKKNKTVQQDLSAANDKLMSLLGGGKKDQE